MLAPALPHIESSLTQIWPRHNSDIFKVSPLPRKQTPDFWRQHPWPLVFRLLPPLALTSSDSSFSTPCSLLMLRHMRSLWSVMLSLYFISLCKLISLPCMLCYFSTCPRFPSETHPLGGARWEIGNKKQISSRANSEGWVVVTLSAMWRSTHIWVPFGLDEKGCCDPSRMPATEGSWLIFAHLLGAIPLLPNYTEPTQSWDLSYHKLIVWPSTGLSVSRFQEWPLWRLTSSTGLVHSGCSITTH